MSAKLKEDEFERRFDAGESLESLGFDLDKAVIEQPQIKRVNVDFPDSVVAKLDRHAALMGITRQALIKVWIFERLKEEAAKPAFVTSLLGHYRAQHEFQFQQEMLKRLIGTHRTGPESRRYQEEIRSLVELMQSAQGLSESSGLESKKRR